MISKLSREFALKTEPERRTAYAEMLLSPVMHTDCTNARENGKNCQVYVFVTPDGKALYFAREKKEHEGVKGTVTRIIRESSVTVPFIIMEQIIRNVLLMYCVI